MKCCLQAVADKLRTGNHDFCKQKIIVLKMEQIQFKTICLYNIWYLPSTLQPVQTYGLKITKNVIQRPDIGMLKNGIF